VNAQVHTFVVDDPQMIENCTELKRLSKLMHDAGYMQYTIFVLPDVEEEEKVFHMCHHSEKLAIACGLINKAPGLHSK
jgi:hypothetical protein